MRSRTCFKENSSLHISSAEFLSDLFYPKISIYPPKFPNDLSFSHLGLRANCFSFFHWTLHNHYCTNSLSSLHLLSQHCTFCASLHIKTGPDAQTIKLLPLC